MTWKLKRLAALLVTCGALALIAAPTASAQDPVVFAAGDIACDPADPAFNGGNGTATACRQKATAALLTAPFAAVIAVGDVQYDSATLSNFQQSYDPSWGRVKAQTVPVIGNHEGTTRTSGGGFCEYFGAAAHCNPSGQQGSAAYYSTDIGAWHVVVLNSNCAAAGGCGPGSSQYRWLAADLAANPRPCTLAAWHHPRWSSGHDGSAAYMGAIWQLFHANGGDLVLSGHSHDYERFAPMGPTGAIDPADGMRSFVVGTGGVNFTGLGNSGVRGSEVRQNSTFGVLRLVLRPTGYDWAFVPVAGRTFRDSGSQSCRGFALPDTQAPSTPADLRATPAGPTRVDLAWTGSTDTAGVTGYEIWRGTGNDPLTNVATTAGTGTAFADGALAAGRTYRYQVRAKDAAGNLSAFCPIATATTPVPTVAAGPQRGRLLARWRLKPRAARRALARGWLRIPRRRSAPTVIRARVGGRLAARRRTETRRPVRLHLAPWSHRPRNRGKAVTVIIRRG
jgi:hypothetical protein